MHEVWVQVDRAYDSTGLMTTSLRSGEAMQIITKKNESQDKLHLFMVCSLQRKPLFFNTWIYFVNTVPVCANMQTQHLLPVKPGSLGCPGTAPRIKAKEHHRQWCTATRGVALAIRNWVVKPLSVGFLSRDAERFAHMDALMEQGLKLVLVMHQSFTSKLLTSLIPALTSCWVKAGE